MIPNTVTICSPDFDPSYSYGRIAHHIAEQLKLRDIWVNYIPGQEDAEVPDNRFKLTPHAILLGHPTNFKWYGGAHVPENSIAVTMFESTRLPKNWDISLNGLAGVVVPAPWVADVFRDNGVKVPIEVVPLGVDKDFEYAPRNLDGRFRFLLIGDRGDRKNWIGGGMAFSQAFGVEDMSVELVVKVHDDGSFLANLIDPNVTLLKQDMTNQELARLYQSCHVLIFPSKGEGFGLPPLEMIRTGGVTICPDYGGLEWAVKAGAIPTPYTLEPAWKGHKEFESCGMWALPDRTKLAENLISIRNEYPRLHAQAVANAAGVASKFTWEYFVDGLLDFWDRL